MLNRTAKLALAGLLSLVVAACIPEFANPLTGGNPADPALVGTWSAKSESDSDAMLLDITAKDGGIGVTMSDPKGASDGKSFSFKGATAEVGGALYVSLMPVGDDLGGQMGFMIFKYESKDGQVHVQPLDETAIADAVAKGLLKGTTTGSGTDTSPKVTATSEEIAAFFATPAGQAAFKSGPDDILTLTRVTR